MKKPDADAIKVYNLVLQALIDLLLKAQKEHGKFALSFEWAVKRYNGEEVPLSDELKKSHAYMLKTKKAVKNLKSQVQNYLSISKDLSVNDDKLMFMMREDDEGAKLFLDQLAEFEKWCEESIKKVSVKRKIGRNAEIDGFEIIYGCEIMHFYFFSSNGPLTPDGYHINSIKNALEKAGINVANDTIKNRVIKYRRAQYGAKNKNYDVVMAHLTNLFNDYFPIIIKYMEENIDLSLLISQYPNDEPTKVNEPLKSPEYPPPEEILKMQQEFLELLAKNRSDK